MSHEYVLTCDSCERVISAEQARMLGCCSNCERALRASWAKLENASASSWDGPL